MQIDRRKKTNHDSVCKYYNDIITVVYTVNDEHSINVTFL